MELIKEKNYAFRKRMRILHQPDLRNPAIFAGDGEAEVTNDWALVLPEGYGDVVLTAAQDFLDFMLRSMDTSLLLCKKQVEKPSIILSVVSAQTEDYVISVGENITITGKSERGLAQALYCLEDKMSLKQAPILKKEEIRHTFLFSPRMVHSGYEIDNYPNEHLSAIAHAGMDAILVFVKGVNQTTTGFMDFNELVSRSAKYGIDVYAYSYLKSEMHPEDEGAQEFYDNLYGKIFEACPGFKGVILVGESVGFPSHDPNVAPGNAYLSADGFPHKKPRPGWWPCEDYPLWLECVKKAVRQHKPDADIVFWTYNWGNQPEEARLKLIESLPTDISLQATFEMFEDYPLGSIKQTVADYSLAFAGPGGYFSSEAKAAKKKGIRLYSMTNTGGLTWDMGTIPYEPMPYQWMNRYKGIREASENCGLCGLMESHHYGIYPSFISDLAKQCFIKENVSMEDCLKEVVAKRFGMENISVVCDALKLWSEAIRNYTPTDADQYGAFRCGPSYPLCLINRVKPETVDYAHFGNGILEVLYPADYSPVFNLPYGRGMLPSLRLSGELDALGKMLTCMEDGVRILKDIPNPNQELLYLINLGEYICCCVQTGIHAKEWYLLTSRMKIETDRDKVRAMIPQVKDLLEAERQNALRAIPLVEKDSRLGWEPSMEYIADAERIRWKLRHLDYVLDFELPCFENGSGDKWF